MCTVTLSYDKDSVEAQRALAALLATGMFLRQDDAMDVTTADALDELSVDEARELSDFMKQARNRMPDRNVSLEEACDVVVREIRSIYEMKNAI